MLKHHPFSVFPVSNTATTQIYTLSLHDALPIWRLPRVLQVGGGEQQFLRQRVFGAHGHSPVRSPSLIVPPAVSIDRKSTRLNSSHRCISYAVFCLKKKKNLHTCLRIRLLYRSRN